MAAYRPSILRIVTILLLSSVFFLLSTVGVYANSLVWHHSFGNAINVGVISISKTHPDVVYASTTKGSEFDIIKSTDGGGSWISIKSDLPLGSDINAISIYAQDDSVVGISLWNGGVFMSENGGRSWTKIFQTYTPRSVAIGPTSSSTIFVGVGGSNDSSSGIYKTIDKGVSWAKISPVSLNNSQINIDPRNPLHLLADIGGPLYRSYDGGLSWTQLPFSNASSLNTVFDVNQPDTLYTGRFDIDEGIYKSTNGGNSWEWFTGGPKGKIYRLAQEQNGSLYAANVTKDGGLWRSTNGGSMWENINSDLWGSWQNVFAVDVAGNKVFAGVEYFGIYWAHTNGESPPVPKPKPVVFIPGFAGSWSYKGIVENQATTYSDWQLMPLFTSTYYGPLLQTLRNAGLEDNKTLLTFAYDFRQSVADSAVWLNSFLADKISGVKTNIVAHSMGGVVARYCFEKVAGCSDRINKIVTAGSPQTGTVKSYLLWEGGQIDEENVPMKTIEEIALHAANFPYFSDKDIIQNRFPGVRDLLPTFDYITGKPYVAMSDQGKNPLLTGMGPDSAEFLTVLTTLSGNSLPTYSGFSPDTRSGLDRALGLWADGKPGSFNNDIGDGTVLRSSSQMGGADNKEYAMNHTDYLRQPASLTDILNSFGLTAGVMATGTDEPTAILAFVIHSPATISTTGGENINGQTIFITDPINDSYPVTITGLANGQFQLDGFWVKQGKPTVKKTFNGSAAAGSTQTINFTLVSQTFSDQNGDELLASFRQKVRAAKMRYLGTIDAAVTRAAANIKNNRQRQNAFADLEKAYTDCILLLSKESSGTSRSLLRETCEQISTLAVKLSELFGQPAGVSKATADAARAATAVSQKLNKTFPTARDGANLALAQNFLNQANDFLSLGQNYPGRLSSLAAVYLLGR